MKVAVVYWSGTGNTEAMANAIVEGVKAKNAEVQIFTANEFDVSMMDNYDSIAFGCAAMGAEVREEDEFEPMFAKCEEKLAGKKIALFGSYGWGDGEWMRNWEERCINKGSDIIQEPLIINETPDDEGIERCKKFGEKMII